MREIDPWFAVESVVYTIEIVRNCQKPLVLLKPFIPRCISTGKIVDGADSTQTEIPGIERSDRKPAYP